MYASFSNPSLLKTFGSLLFAAIRASNLVSMSHWTEQRGVNDDFCYLRQAHLFQRFGLGGFDTSLARDDDGYNAARLSGLPGAILRDVWLHDARLPSPDAVARAILCRMKRAVVIAALLVCSPAVVHGQDRATISGDDSVRGVFCTSPKDHSDCLEACALRLKEMQRYRACTAACTSLYCPRK